MLVLGALGSRDRKETDVLQLICSVSLIAKVGNIKAEDDDDSSNSEFRLKPRQPRTIRLPRSMIAAAEFRAPNVRQTPLRRYASLCQGSNSVLIHASSD